jgi:hypothetical protein
MSEGNIFNKSLTTQFQVYKNGDFFWNDCLYFIYNTINWINYYNNILDLEKIIISLYNLKLISKEEDYKIGILDYYPFAVHPKSKSGISVSKIILKTECGLILNKDE